MIHYVYIHGFNSGKESRSGSALANLLGESVFCPEYDAGLPWRNCMEMIEMQIKAACGVGDIFLMGTSLGGFYASQIRLPGIVRMVIWNPVIYPAAQLECFLGPNVRFTDGLDWNFERHALLSYAQAPDQREWRNFYWREKAEDNPAPNAPLRYVILGNHDELLDSSLAMSFWIGHARTMTIDSGHRVEDFSHAREILKMGV